MLGAIGSEDAAIAEETARLLGAPESTEEAARGLSARLLPGGELTAWPLRDGPHRVGLLAVAWGAAPSRAMLAAGADAAGPLALALGKARLFEVNRERLATLLALHETGVDLGSSRDRDALLRSIVDRAQGLVHGTMAGLYLKREDGRLELVLASGMLATYVGAVLAPGEGVAGTVAATREPILLDDYRAWPAALAVFSTAGIGSVIGVPILWRGEVLGSLFVDHEVPGRFGAADLETVRLFAEQAAVAIANARLIGELKGAAEELALAYDATLEGWVRALDLRDKETEGHTQRVVDRTLDLARRAGMAEEALIHVRRGALLHDIGKVGIPDRILQKAGPLTDEEWAVMRLHPTYAHDMLSGIGFLRPALDIPWAHHEKWDGTGYPRGLSGEEIPLRGTGLRRRRHLGRARLRPALPQGRPRARGARLPPEDRRDPPRRPARRPVPGDRSRMRREGPAREPGLRRSSRTGGRAAISPSSGGSPRASSSPLPTSGRPSSRSGRRPCRWDRRGTC